MSGQLMLDVDQAGELKRGFRRVRGSDGSKWTNANVKKLSEGNILGSVLDVLGGRAKIISVEPAEETAHRLIQVDRSMRPAYPNFVEEVLHPELEMSGPAEYNIGGMVQEWLHPEQERGVVKGNEIYKFLKEENLLQYQFGLADLQAIQAKGIKFFRRYLPDKWIYGWKSVVRIRGRLAVPYIRGLMGDVLLEWKWLNEDLIHYEVAFGFAN